MFRILSGSETESLDSEMKDLGHGPQPEQIFMIHHSCLAWANN